MNNKRIVSILMFFVLFLILVPHAQSALVGKVSLIEGRADVLKPGTRALVPVKVNSPVDVGDIYRVKSDGRVEITFFDGGAIRIAPATRLEIKDYSSDANKTSNVIRLSTGHVQVISGKTFIQKVSQYMEGNRFEVHTPNAVAGVRGSNMVVSFIRSVTTTLFIDGKGYQYNPADPTKTMALIVKGEISFVQAPFAAPTPPRKATPSETNHFVTSVTVTPRGTTGGSSSDSVMTESALMEIPALVRSTSPISDPVVDNPTIFTPPVIPVTITEDAPLVVESVQPGFSTSFSGQLFRIFFGTKGKTTAYSSEPQSYSSRYIQTSGSRLGSGSVNYDAGITENYIYGNGFGGTRTLFYGASSGTEYFPDGTYVVHAQSPETSITSRGTWSLPFNVASLASPPAGYNVSLYAQMPANTLELNGVSSGTIASSQLSWDSAFPFTIGGSFSPIDTASAGNDFRMQVTGTTNDGGAYTILGGGIVSKDPNRAGGLVYGIAIDPSNRGIIWSGDYAGGYDPATAAWNGSGTLTPTIMNASLNIPASSLVNYLDYGFIHGQLGGSFGVPGGFGAEGWGQTLSILGQPWGIYSMTFGIDSVYSNPSSVTTFTSGFNGWAEFGSYQDNTGSWKKNMGFYIARVINGVDTLLFSGGGKIGGDVTGTFWTYTGMGTVAGKLAAGYGTGGLFHGTSAGQWQKTQDFSFSGVVDRGGARRFIAWTSGSFTYEGGQSFSYHYARDSQAGYTWYNQGGGSLINRSYVPDRFGLYSTYEQQNISGTTATISRGYYGSDISTIPFLAPDGYTSSSGPTDMYSTTGTNGYSVAIMGGVGNLWAATSSSPVAVYFGGEYTPFYATETLPYLYNARVMSYNPYLDNYTTALGGAYTGMITAIMDQGNRIVENGNIVLLYINNGMAGVMGGAFSGTVNPYDESWQATGGLYPVAVGQTAISPENMMSNIKSTSYQLAENQGSSFSVSTSGFWDGSTWSGSITPKEMDLRSIWIDGMGWGITRTILGGKYDGAPQATWRSLFEWENAAGGGNMHELIGREMHGSTWSGNRFSGSLRGYRGWISATEAGVNLSFANLAGTFNPSVLTWQAVSTGMWMNLNQFLALQATSPETLQKLNIPCVEVGSVTMSGSGNGFSNLTVNNARFFSTTSGGNPMIWATNNVTGTYTSIPAVSGVTTVSGGGLNASLVMKQFDTTNNKWLAGVGGTGTLSGGSYAGPVVFKGAGAGKVVPTSATTGSVTGVAGGIAGKGAPAN